MSRGERGGGGGSKRGERRGRRGRGLLRASAAAPLPRGLPGICRAHHGGLAADSAGGPSLRLGVPAAPSAPGRGESRQEFTDPSLLRSCF